MSKSIGAKVMSSLLHFWPKLTEEETMQKIAETRAAGEKPTAPPTNIPSRYEDCENGRVFYLNEKSVSPYTVFYIHGGAYFYDFMPNHWQFMEKVVKATNAQVIAPAYRLVPFATWKEGFDLIVPLYKKHCAENPNKKIILMGDSAGGGFSLALTEYFKANGIRLPDELILFSPWADVTMENEEIPEFQDKDPFLFTPSLPPLGKLWAGGLDPHDPRISPIYGDVSGLRNVTVFAGTDEIIYPDSVKLFNLLDKDRSNELVVGEGMNHVYPLFPIKEADSADNKVFHIIMR